MSEPNRAKKRKVKPEIAQISDQFSRAKSSAAGLFASDAVASTFASHMDERSKVLASALARKASADAHRQVAEEAAKDYYAIVRASVRSFAEIADEISPKASPEVRATMIGALISAYGAPTVDLHQNLVRTTSFADGARAHIESLPEFSKHIERSSNNAFVRK